MGSMAVTKWGQRKRTAEARLAIASKRLELFDLEHPYTPNTDEVRMRLVRDVNIAGREYEEAAYLAARGL